MVVFCVSESLLPPGQLQSLPILPLRNSVLFPAAIVPVNVGRARSVRLIEEVMNSESALILALTQQRPETEDPTFSELHTVGTATRVLKVIRLSSGNYSVVLQGICRGRLMQPEAMHPCMRGQVDRIDDPPTADVELNALAANLREATRQLFDLLPGQAREAIATLDNVLEAGAVADLIASNLPMETAEKQKVLQTIDVRERLRRVLNYVNRQNEVHQVKKKITTMVRDEMSKSQREFLLRQQLKAIKQELGESGDEEDEIDLLLEKVAEGGLPVEADAAARKQIRRMKSMNSASAEYHVARNYVEWILDLPWEKEAQERFDVGEAERVLREDHFGLEKPKRRIIEYIAVRKLQTQRLGNRIGRSPIVCFVGPPGVGKTSLAKSIARATGREFTRVALGGVQDEAEIRGHRRTYVGAFPGKIIGALKKAGSKNPVMLLDEIDKLGKNNRGDPASALLEVLDPEQNIDFRDHYLEVAFDLSKVLFVATANRVDTIPAPLLDRMELIELSGYVREEKLEIAKQFVLPRQLADHGLSPERLELKTDAFEAIIDGYTREAGVRGLDKQIAALCRAVAVRLAHGEDAYVNANAKWVTEVLGPPRYDPPVVEKIARPGVCTGLAWSASGGQLLMVEAKRMQGSGKLRITGQAGDILQESAATAFSYIRSRADSFGLPHDFLSTIDIHLHFPQGAMKKDIASAGVTIYTALLSVLTRHKVRNDTAMTGELTLRGNVLGVSGVREKCMTAHRAGLSHVILPKRNEVDLDDIPENVRADLDIHFVEKADELLSLVLENQPPPESFATN